MAVNHFPPQAYTRDMLATAYEWLRAQPLSVRELAKDSDSLVALYMQSRRRADAAAQATSSSESFKQDLKTLAEGLKQFEDPALAGQPMPQQILPNTTAHYTLPPSSAQNVQTQQSQHVPAPPAPRTHAVTTHAHAPAPTAPQPQYVNHTPIQQTVVNPVSTSHHLNSLDHLTRDKVRSVQNRFNLSTENEALRMLVALGYDHIAQFLPKN